VRALRWRSYDRDCDLTHSARPLGVPVSAFMGCLAYQLQPVNMEDGMLAHLTVWRLESEVNKYQIATRTHGTGFDVHIVTSEGVRHTILGFVTEPEAQAWIAQDQRLSHAADLADPFGVRGDLRSQ
jgi:hypothetical protein